MISQQAAFLSPPDMIIVMVVALIVFGPAKLPEVGRQLGQAIRELKKLTSELTDSIHNETSEIRGAFDTTSPYTLKPGPIDAEPHHSLPMDGYSNKESDVSVVTADPKLMEEHVELSHPSPGQVEAAKVQLTATTQTKAGESTQ